MLQSRKKILIILSILVAVIIILIAITAAPRFGKTRTDIQVIPDNATVTLNGEKIKAGIHYLKPGTYTFKATAEGYGEDTQVVIIGDDEIIIGLLPEPESDDALKWLENHPEIQSKREELGGINAQREGAESRAANPIMEKLPYIDPESLYAIDYGFTADTPSHIFFLIGNSSPEGRANALRWLQNEKVNIATSDIRYDDYVNPLVQ